LKLRESTGVAAVVVALACSAAGCGKPVLRVADASLGDYYSDQEFKKLREDQRDEYCAELARQDSTYRAELLDAREALDALRARSRGLRVEGDSLFALASRLDSQVAERRASSRRVPTGGGTGPGGSVEAGRYIVRPGDSLWRISRSEDAYGEGALWKRIFDENRGRIRDPNLIYPGQELTIPR
jgi:nucleoid-associated protein YgaU